MLFDFKPKGFLLQIEGCHALTLSGSVGLRDSRSKFRVNGTNSLLSSATLHVQRSVSRLIRGHLASN